MSSHVYQINPVKAASKEVGDLYLSDLGGGVQLSPGKSYDLEQDYGEVAINQSGQLSEAIRMGWVVKTAKPIIAKKQQDTPVVEASSGKKDSKKPIEKMNKGELIDEYKLEFKQEPPDTPEVTKAVLIAALKDGTPIESPEPEEPADEDEDSGSNGDDEGNESNDEDEDEDEDEEEIDPVKTLIDVAINAEVIVTVSGETDEDVTYVLPGESPDEDIELGTSEDEVLARVLEDEALQENIRSRLTDSE